MAGWCATSIRRLRSTRLLWVNFRHYVTQRINTDSVA